MRRLSCSRMIVKRESDRRLEMTFFFPSGLPSIDGAEQIFVGMVSEGKTQVRCLGGI